MTTSFPVHYRHGTRRRPSRQRWSRSAPRRLRATATSRPAHRRHGVEPMLTPARIQSMLKPLEETTRSLSLAADARRQGRPVDLDPGRLIALVDATTESIARELGPEVLKDLAVAADR